MENIKLKKCPFCGGEVIFGKRKKYDDSLDNTGYDFKIKCKGCGIESPKTYEIRMKLANNGEILYTKDDRLAAVTDWNTRADSNSQTETTENKYSIYQLKDNHELDPYRFLGTSILKKWNQFSSVIVPQNYNLIYTGKLSEFQKSCRNTLLETIYHKFNIHLPADFKGHSLSVGDIIIIYENGKKYAYIVESVGFSELPNFMRDLETMENNK